MLKRRQNAHLHLSERRALQMSFFFERLRNWIKEFANEWAWKNRVTASVDDHYFKLRLNAP